MNVSRSTRTLAAGSVAALLALTAGCGSSGSATGDAASRSASSSPGSSSSSTASQTPGSESVGLTTSNIGPKLVAAQKKAGSYAFQITSSVSGQSIKGSGVASLKGAKPAVRTNLDLHGSHVEAILRDGLIYLKSPVFHGDKPWLKVDPKSKTGLGALLGQLGGAGDPSRNLDALFKASKVTRVGSEKVGGVDTTHYSVVVPRAALADAMGYPQQLVKLLPPTLTSQIWADSDDLVRKLESAVTVKGEKSTTVVTFDKYGEPVSVAAPPAGQVTTKSPLG